jgi:hypothetical protein
MGHSEYDPAFRCRKAWNAGRKLGAKRPLKAQRFGQSDSGTIARDGYVIGRSQRGQVSRRGWNGAGCARRIRLPEPDQSYRPKIESHSPLFEY